MNKKIENVQWLLLGTASPYMTATFLLCDFARQCRDRSIPPVQNETQSAFRNIIRGTFSGNPEEYPWQGHVYTICKKTIELLVEKKVYKDEGAFHKKMNCILNGETSNIDLEIFKETFDTMADVMAEIFIPKRT